MSESLEQMALRIAHAMVLNTAINDEWFIEFARRLLAEQQKQKQEPVARLKPCKGKNCGSTDYRLHSADCFAEHEATVNPGGKYSTPLQEPIAFATNGYGKISLYWREGLTIDFIPNGTTIGLCAAPVAKAQDGMVTVPRDVISTLNESREELFKVSGSAFLAGEKCKKGDGYACYQLVCSANNGIAYALSLLDAAMLTKELK